MNHSQKQSPLHQAAMRALQSRNEVSNFGELQGQYPAGLVGQRSGFDGAHSLATGEPVHTGQTFTLAISCASTAANATENVGLFDPNGGAITNPTGTDVAAIAGDYARFLNNLKHNAFVLRPQNIQFYAVSGIRLTWRLTNYGLIGKSDSGDNWTPQDFANSMSNQPTLLMPPAHLPVESYSFKVDGNTRLVIPIEKPTSGTNVITVTFAILAYTDLSKAIHGESVVRQGR